MPIHQDPRSVGKLIPHWAAPDSPPATWVINGVMRLLPGENNFAHTAYFIPTGAV